MVEPSGRLTPLRGAVAVFILFYLLVGGDAGAETLADVVRAVADGSPLVARERARAAAADATVKVERAAARPRLSGDASALQGTRGANAQAGFDRTLDSGLNLQFPIYSGGKTTASIRGARARAGAATAELDGARADAVAGAVTAYLDVLRDREAVALTRDNAGLLERTLEAARRRFAAGDGTRTDVSQSLARLSLGQGRLEAARSRLAQSEDRYAQLVGTVPGELAPAPPLPAPPDPDRVAPVTAARSPAVASADATLAAARADIAAARADGRPSLSAAGSGQYHNYRQSYAGYPDQRGGGAQATVSVSVPIYSGGLVRAEVARARAGEAEASGTREIAERRAVADARAAAIDYRAEAAMIVLDKQRVAASREALAGTQNALRGGERTVLDVLNASLELIDAQSALLDSRHDAYVASIEVLRALNRLDCLAVPGADECATAMAGG